MNTRLLLSLACMLTAAACADDMTTAAPVADAAAAPTLPTSSGDAGAPSKTDPAVPSADAATPANPSTMKIPLLVWVDDLVDNHTRDDAAPDTVDDKNIADNEDPSAFDTRFK